ncbi:hypothetical protein [Shewanella sp. Isolate11]|uniref:hypothetical protein n=1 Tax=Shewanella sp. Isolate11 TaxID=2908530 RepID=UPI001EFCBF8E|nr:hypothetical protein [Shewanella sp. Isolate11]MCG9695934.1 hypothetical protein [Shewanella sp. Isolate11]
MIKVCLALVLSLGMISTASASQLDACSKNTESDICHSYLEGVVDGALMYKPNAVGKRLEGNGYESRALKYRSGSRFQQANRTYCEDRIPDRDALVSGLVEAYLAGSIKTPDELTEVVYSLMDCQRLK